ncbi:hypothetical protein ACFQZO_31020 [Bradyrhizobium sp. GCM10027634]|uniref:hypothetical protein n=1 Tax=unclassified Bradyrhizobium TaxID=2631580 RepID=UPI00263A51E4|nr:hypothetical protein [Bradyrhizobium sp. WYCCWR 12677]MDN5005294.1 hypothetical protein [Bradyrhizobium sp. WYCCWR 12677]
MPTGFRKTWKVNCARYAIALTLSIWGAGCATFEPVRATSTRPVAWDGLGRNPNQTKSKMHRPVTAPPASLDRISERERALTTLRPYSGAWWAVHDEIEGERDRQLAEKLVICRDCLSGFNAAETTGSLAGSGR